MKSEAPTKGSRLLRQRVYLLIASLAVALLLVEAMLAMLGLPQFYKPHSLAKQFNIIWTDQKNNVPFYVNARSGRIRFYYDENPRGYFGSENEVDHTVNSMGFRGKEFPLEARNKVWTGEKGQGVFRLVFLGDSWTFGEGVKDGD